ncbi:MAG: hypothetical protein KBT63_00240 [Porticoccaceae bacterium]|nr:hypothetical protein [Porticoccaceae bacterium]
MKITLIAIASFLFGALVSYLYVTDEKNELIEDLALVNIIQGFSTNHFLTKGKHSTIQVTNNINISHNLSSVMEVYGSLSSQKQNEANARLFNGLYLQWLQQPPKYIEELTDTELREWTKNEYKEQMEFLKQFHIQCKNKVELKCKNS